MQVLGPDMGPLLLSSYIEACDYDKAKQLSKVELFQQYAQATAYSGYITVNSTTKSHLFFLFIVSQGNNSNDPFLLWTQGGPGLSALFGQFLQNGPNRDFYFGGESYGARYSVAVAHDLLKDKRNLPINVKGQATTLWEAVVLGMSHYGAVDKPDAAWHLITKFIEGTLACPSPTKSQEGLKEN
ncbi:hypothetical protein MTO96_050650 [Rhipicephalus appendiculatus]